MKNNSSFVDLCGLDLQTQMTSINSALERATQGGICEVLTDQQMIATYILPKALAQNVRCKVSPAEGGWKIDLTPR